MEWVPVKVRAEGSFNDEIRNIVKAAKPKLCPDIAETINKELSGKMVRITVRPLYQIINEVMPDGSTMIRYRKTNIRDIELL